MNTRRERDELEARYHRASRRRHLAICTGHRAELAKAEAELAQLRQALANVWLPPRLR